MNHYVPVFRANMTTNSTIKKHVYTFVLISSVSIYCWHPQNYWHPFCIIFFLIFSFYLDFDTLALSDNSNLDIDNYKPIFIDYKCFNNTFFSFIFIQSEIKILIIILTNWWFSSWLKSYSLVPHLHRLASIQHTTSIYALRLFTCHHILSRGTPVRKEVHSSIILSVVSGLLS